MNTTAYEKGAEIARLGKSAHFNPYRQKGSSKDYRDFIMGWKSVIY